LENSTASGEDPDNSKNTVGFSHPDAESVHTVGALDPELAEVVRTWPTFPGDVRRGILEMVRIAQEH
jgi:hypothetical protein